MVRIELAGYLADDTGPMTLVLDLRITHKRWGSSSNPLPNGHLHYPRPDDIDRPLNEAAADKIRDYRADYNNRPSNSISFMTDVVATTSGCLHCECVRILFLQTHRDLKPTAFLQLQELIMHNITRPCSVSSALLSSHRSNLRLIGLFY